MRCSAEKDGDNDIRYIVQPEHMVDYFKGD